MKQVLITGAQGFIGKNLDIALRRHPDVTVEHANSDDSKHSLCSKVAAADVVFHLAGSNRPQDPSDFQRINVDLTQVIVGAMQAQKSKQQTIVFASSIQAESDTPYGVSKKLAEEAIATLTKLDTKKAKIYRLPNVFGKWSRPNYNSVVATFCYNISRKLPITITDSNRVLRLVYVDDVVTEWLQQMRDQTSLGLFQTVSRVFECTLEDLAKRIQAIHDMRSTLHVPDLSDRLNFALHATYTSFLDETDFARSVTLRPDDRGWLFEMTKSRSFGQVFVSTTKPGIVRGNHYHDSKIERFCLIQGTGISRFRKIDSEHVIEYPVNDSEIQMVDIPPGYTHSIENVGPSNMIVLFWANEIFDPATPDTNFEKVVT